MDLVEFLRARLDDDERLASGSGDLGWLTFRQAHGTMDHTEAASRAPDGTWIVAGREATGFVSATIVHREARVLRDVEARRRIVDGCVETLAEEDSWDPQLDGGSGEEFALARWTLRLLASMYADHPDYRDEWKP